MYWFYTVCVLILHGCLQGRSLFVNKALAGLFGKTVPEMNSHWSCPDKGAHEESNRRAIETSETLHFAETKFTDAQGQERFFRVTKTPYRTADSDVPVSRGLPSSSKQNTYSVLLMCPGFLNIQPCSLRPTIDLAGASIPAKSNQSPFAECLAVSEKCNQSG